MLFKNCLKLVVEKANWKTKQDVLADFPKAKMIQNNQPCTV